MKKRNIILAFIVLSVFVVLSGCRSYGGPIPCPRHSLDILAVFENAWELLASLSIW